MSIEPTLLLLAAGVGSRYGGLKQIDPVGPSGETIMDYSIYDARRAGFGKVVFVLRRDFEKPFRESVGRRFEKQIAVEYVFQELDNIPNGFRAPPNRTKPWGTGHAILIADRVIQEPFAAINADDFYGAASFRVLCQHLQASSDYAMVGFVLRNTLSEHGSVSRGVCRLDANGYLESIAELTRIEKDGAGARHTDSSGQVHRLTGGEIVSMNLWGFPPSVFGHLREQFVGFLREHGSEEKSEFYIPSVVNALVSSRQARVKVLRSPDSWFGITYKEDRPQAVERVRQLVARGVYPARLWEK